MYVYVKREKQTYIKVFKSSHRCVLEYGTFFLIFVHKYYLIFYNAHLPLLQ